LPLYEYQCANDGTFEQMRKFSDPPLTACPKCGGPIEKLMSAPAIQFTGSGWYITDYARKSSGGSDAGKDGKEKSPSSSEKKDAGASSSAGTPGSSGSSGSSGSTSTGSGSSDKK
jgi:putative FmdB family regulatory protein